MRLIYSLILRYLVISCNIDFDLQVDNASSRRGVDAASMSNRSSISGTVSHDRTDVQPQKFLCCNDILAG